MKAKIDIYGGKDPRTLPAYSVRDAAHYLQLPRATIVSWSLGRHYPTQHGPARFHPVIRVADQARQLLSFQNLVELYVLGAVRRKYAIKLPKVRRAIEHLRVKMHTDHPLADQQLFTDRSDLFYESIGRMVSASQDGQTVMRTLEPLLQRIERAPDGFPIRLFPFTTTRDEEMTRPVSIDPRVRFGRPCLAATNVPTAIIAERYKAGDTMRDLAEDYGVQPELIEQAIRYEYESKAA